ncbi:hypothetical protein [Candidatus Pelagibacter communis]|uniref:hypothetical protein n=1 Tax=Pelagibacter ubique TaxID=198252 RepID=UPI003EE10ECA
MKDIDKKIKGISIELDKDTKLEELDNVIEDFEKTTDDKHKLDVSIDILNSTLHMKKVRKPYISLATKDGKAVNKKDEIDIKVKK